MILKICHFLHVTLVLLTGKTGGRLFSPFTALLDFFLFPFGLASSDFPPFLGFAGSFSLRTFFSLLELRLLFGLILYPGALFLPGNFLFGILVSSTALIPEGPVGIFWDASGIPGKFPPAKSENTKILKLGLKYTFYLNMYSFAFVPLRLQP
jgi:hypothetical protein